MAQAQTPKLSHEQELLKMLKDGADADKVANFIVNKFGFDSALKSYFSNDEFRTAWDKYYNVTIALTETGFFRSIVHHVGINDIDQEDHTGALLSAIRSKYGGKDEDLEVAKAYFVCGWDPERTAEHIADNLKLVNYNRVFKWEKSTEDEEGNVTKGGKKGLIYEIEGGAAYYYQHDPIFKRCWDAYYTGSFEPLGEPGTINTDEFQRVVPFDSLRKERFKQLMSEAGEWFDYVNVILNQLGQLGNNQTWAAIGSALNKWWKERSGGQIAVSGTWHAANFALPMESAWHLAFHSGTYKAAGTTPNPMNIIAAINEDQANTIDVIATALVFLKFAKLMKAGKAGGAAAVGSEEAAKTAAKEALEAAKEAAKREVQAKVSDPDALANLNAKIDAAAAKLAENIDSGRMPRRRILTRARATRDILEVTLLEDNGVMSVFGKELLAVYGDSEKLRKFMMKTLLTDYERMAPEAQLQMFRTYFELRTSIRKAAAEGAETVAKEGAEVAAEGNKAGTKASRIAARFAEVRKEVSDKIGKLTIEIEELKNKLKSVEDAAEKAQLYSSISIKEAEVDALKQSLAATAKLEQSRLVRLAVRVEGVPAVVKKAPDAAKAVAKAAGEEVGLRERFRSQLLELEQRESQLIERIGAARTAGNFAEELAAGRELMKLDTLRYKVTEAFYKTMASGIVMPLELVAGLSYLPPGVYNLFLKRFPWLFDFSTPYIYYMARAAVYPVHEGMAQKWNKDETGVLKVNIETQQAASSLTQVNLMRRLKLSDEDISYVLQNEDLLDLFKVYVGNVGARNAKYNEISRLINYHKDYHKQATAESKDVDFIRDQLSTLGFNEGSILIILADNNMLSSVSNVLSSALTSDEDKFKIISALLSIKKTEPESITPPLVPLVAVPTRVKPAADLPATSAPSSEQPAENQTGGPHPRMRSGKSATSQKGQNAPKRAPRD